MQICSTSLLTEAEEERLSCLVHSQKISQNFWKKGKFLARIFYKSIVRKQRRRAILDYKYIKIEDQRFTTVVFIRKAENGLEVSLAKTKMSCIDFVFRFVRGLLRRQKSKIITCKFEL